MQICDMCWKRHNKLTPAHGDVIRIGTTEVHLCREHMEDLLAFIEESGQTADNPEKGPGQKTGTTKKKASKKSSGNRK